MTKYYRRVGTTAFRFQIEAHIQKIELKVPTTNPYPQRLSVIFKRGLYSILAINLAILSR